MSNATDFAKVFLSALSKAVEHNSNAVRVIAETLGVPHRPELEKDGPRGPRIRTFYENGRLKSSRVGELLPGSVDNSPDTYNSVNEALALMKNDTLTGMYFHAPSLNLVLMTLSGKKIGIRMIDLRGRTPYLIQELKSMSEARMLS